MPRASFVDIDYQNQFIIMAGMSNYMYVKHWDAIIVIHAPTLTAILFAAM